MNRLLLVGVGFLTGCVGTFTNVSRFRYAGLDLKLIVAEQSRIDAHCRKLGTKLNDSGQPIAPGGIACCMDQRKRTMWVSSEYISCIPHELCHLEGRPALECDRLHIKP